MVHRTPRIIENDVFVSSAEQTFCHSIPDAAQQLPETFGWPPSVFVWLPSKFAWNWWFHFLCNLFVSLCAWEIGSRELQWCERERSLIRYWPQSFGRLLPGVGPTKISKSGWEQLTRRADECGTIGVKGSAETIEGPSPIPSPDRYVTSLFTVFFSLL